MPSSFKLKDGLVQLGVSKPFGVNADGAHLFECLRLLCGTVNLEDKLDSSILKIRYCHLTEQKRRLKRNTILEIINTAFGADVSKSDLESYLNKTRGLNENFWTQVKAELCLALVCYEREQQTRAFLHIYRLLEYFSVALPLFYASVEQDYYKALSALKELTKNPRDGDLAVLKAFMGTVAKEGGYQTHLIKAFYSRGDASWDGRFEKQVTDYVIDAERLASTVDVANKIINIPFAEFPSLFITFRNRLFHNTLSVDNINIDLLYGSDFVCAPLIKPALNWFVLTLCVVLKQNASRYI